MILGLDVGGTQTDTVLIEGTDVLVETKTPTGEDLLTTLREALEKTLADIDPARISRMAFSTTMATNAITQDSLDQAGMIVSAGPGMDPGWFSVGPSYHVVEGCLDHQGLEALPVNRQSVMDASRRIREKGINTVGVVGKFSVHNPVHEEQIKSWVENEFSHVALGHQVSGILNFPRRITTTYLNAALYGLHHEFSNSLTRILDEKDLLSPRYLLKPDGGTMELNKTVRLPARTAQSGPAASVMGAMALDGCKGTALILDIGGTTTDMSVVLDGVPLRAPYGIRLGPFRTLIRSLLTHSVGLGGDSEIHIGEDGHLAIGPIRKGMPVAFGGPAPTPTDAMITLGVLDAGNKEAAKAAMANLGQPFKWDAPKTAQTVLKRMALFIAEAAEAFLIYLNSRPVYTIREVLHEEKIEPSSVVIIGGPAPQIAGYVAKALDLPYRVPGHFAVANAVGAAVARVTSELTLQADTERGTVVIPEANIQNTIGFDFSMDDAVSLAGDVLKNQAVEIGADSTALDISVTEKQSFNIIRGYSRAGRNIRLKMCVTPGLISEWK